MGIEEIRRRAAEAPTVENLTELRTALVARLGEINSAAGDGDLSDAQATEWESVEAEIASTDTAISTAERSARLADSRRRFGAPSINGGVKSGLEGRDVRTFSSSELRDKALKVLDSDGASHLRDDQRTKVARMLRESLPQRSGRHIAERMMLTEDDDYRAAFMQLTTRGVVSLTPEQARAVQRFEEWRGMSVGTPSEGGYGVPVLIDPTIILTAQGSPNDILNVARVETITTNAWKGVTSAGMTWKFRAERTAVTDGSPTLAQPVVNTHRADGFIKWTFEVGQDYPGFASEMEILLREGYSELLAQKLTVGAGDGSDEPYGIVTALDANTNVEIATTTAATLGAVDINKMWAALPVRYRTGPARTAWMSSTGVNGNIQQLGAGNDAAFTVSIDEEGVTRLKGRPAYENDYMASLPTGTAAANLAIVGDWRNYLVAQRAGMSIELVPHVFDTTTNLPTGERGWLAWARVGADSINDLAFRLLQNHT